MILEFELQFADGNGNYAFTEHLRGEREHLLSYLQGVLKMTDFALMRIKTSQIVEVDKDE